MKFLIFMAISTTIFFNACAQSQSNITYEEVADGPVCAKLSSGEKQTFPSMQELNNYEGAKFIYSGPCYDY